MNMRRIYLVSAAMLITAAVSFGQNFNPTVEVTNTYQGNASEVHKPLLGMSVPDSLLRFDLDFDYEVFSKPYQGAYSFKPYMLNMRPAKDAWRGRKLYLKAGAGYTLHPQFEFVYSPEQNGPFQMSVYASHRSYFGNYHEIRPEAGTDRYDLKKTGGAFGGHDVLTSAGFDGRYSWGKAILSFGIGYYGIAAKDSVVKRSYNAADFNIRARSNSDEESYFLYDVGLRGRIASDNLDLAHPILLRHSDNVWNGITADRQSESWFVLDGLAGEVFDSHRSFLVGFEGETGSYGSFYDGNIGRIALVPSYRVKSGRWNLNLGVKFEAMFRNDASDTLAFSKMIGGKGQIVYPDAHVSFEAGNSVTLYADATGGSRLNTYSSQISRSHHFNPSLLVPADHILMTSLIDNTVENLDARIGARGSISSSFWFDLNGGVGIYENLLMESGRFVQSVLSPNIEYSDANLIYANALMGFQAGRFKIDADMRFRNLSFPDKDADNLGFALPKYSGGLRVTYNINSRLYAGFSVDASSWRDGRCQKSYFANLEGDEDDLTLVSPVTVTEEIVKVRVPGYADLGVNCGYKFNRKLELWLEAGNLLCQAIQRNPFYAEKGPWVTAGVSLNL